MRRLALIALLAALAAAATGCGGGSGDANGVLGQTAANLGKIRSGDLTLQVAANVPGGKQVGFSLTGPFALARPGSLPVARITYTRTTGAATQAVTVISTGSKAFVRLGGRVYALRPSQVAGLRGSSPLGAAGGLGQLSIGSWFRNPTVSDGGEVGGVDTDHVHSDLNIVPAANGLIGLANAAGRRAGGPLQGRSARELVRSVKSATIDVWTGKGDHFLRRLVIDAQLAANVPARVKTALGTLGAVHFHLELGIAHPNEPVHVSAPANARPLPA